MPVPRMLAIVVCSCGWRVGNWSRALSSEEMDAVEDALIEAETPRMIRHFQLGHRVRLGDHAPREYLAVIARAAERAREEHEGADVAPAGRLELGPVED